MGTSSRIGIVFEGRVGTASRSHSSCVRCRVASHASKFQVEPTEVNSRGGGSDALCSTRYNISGGATGDATGSKKRGGAVSEMAMARWKNDSNSGAGALVVALKAAADPPVLAAAGAENLRACKRERASSAARGTEIFAVDSAAPLPPSAAGIMACSLAMAPLRVGLSCDSSMSRAAAAAAALCRRRKVVQVTVGTSLHRARARVRAWRMIEPAAVANAQLAIAPSALYSRVELAATMTTPFHAFVNAHASLVGVAAGDVLEALAKEIQPAPPAPLHGMPLNFASPLEEEGFLCLIEALRCGSLFDSTLDAMSKSQTAHEAVLFGLISMFISGAKPDSADFLNSTTAFSVATSLNIPIHESKALSFAKLGGVYEDVDGPLKPFVDLLCKQMHEMGMLLRSRGADRLGQLMSPHASAAALVDFLSKCLPFTFKDEAHGLRFNVKANRLAEEVALRWARFPVPNVPLADAELVAACRQAGVICVVSPTLLEKIDSGQPLISGSVEETALRAACVAAVTELALLSRTDARSVRAALMSRLELAPASLRVVPHTALTAAY